MMDDLQSLGLLVHFWSCPPPCDLARLGASEHGPEDPSPSGCELRTTDARADAGRTQGGPRAPSTYCTPVALAIN